MYKWVITWLIIVRTLCVCYLCFQDTQVLCGSWRASKAVQIYDLGSGKLIDSYPMHTNLGSIGGKESGGEFVYCARFCDPGVVLAGGSGTQSVQAINTNNKQVTQTCKGCVYNRLNVHESYISKKSNSSYPLLHVSIGNHEGLKCNNRDDNTIYIYIYKILRSLNADI